MLSACHSDSNRSLLKSKNIYRSSELINIYSELGEVPLFENLSQNNRNTFQIVFMGKWYHWLIRMEEVNYHESKIGKFKFITRVADKEDMYVIVRRDLRLPLQKIEGILHRLNIINDQISQHEQIIIGGHGKRSAPGMFVHMESLREGNYSFFYREECLDEIAKLAIWLQNLVHENGDLIIK